MEMKKLQLTAKVNFSFQFTPGLTDFVKMGFFLHRGFSPVYHKHINKLRL
jgi:hypothetical protein